MYSEAESLIASVNVEDRKEGFNWAYVMTGIIIGVTGLYFLRRRVFKGSARPVSSLFLYKHIH